MNMKYIVAFLAFLALCDQGFSQADPWKKEQIMPTAVLAAKIGSEKELPLILNVGPMENIKTALKVGATNTSEGIEKLKETVSGTNRNREVVLYCGCCTYSNCPNIRPAFEELQKLGFKNVKVLYIPEGIKPDWVAKGYPME